MIKVNDIVVEPTNFPDCTYLIKFRAAAEKFNYTIEIDWRYEGEHELGLLFFIAKHLRNQYTKVNTILKMLYVPNARMDRTYDSSEVFTLKYFCDFINSLNFDNVIVMDVHSNVTTALLNHVSERPLIELGNLVNKYKNIYFPDEGARKRYGNLLDLSNKYIYTGSKRRNWATGVIEGLDVTYSHKSDDRSPILMIDDICSYGGTFFYSADKLRDFGFNSIDAYCTHAERVVNLPDSKIQLAFEKGLINKLYTTDTLLQATYSKNIEIYHV